MSERGCSTKKVYRVALYTFIKTMAVLKLPDLNIFKPGFTAMILQGDVTFFGQAIAGGIFPFAGGFLLLPFVCP